MNSEQINWFTHPTGDPFADVGGLVIEYLQEKRPGKSILDLIKEVTEIYVKRWGSKLHSFFYNSKITHNSVKGNEGITNTIKYFEGLLEGTEAELGYCRITGQQGNVYKARRDTYMMVGSDALINFHHGFENGIKLSKEALIRCFFVPLAAELLNGQPTIVTSNFKKVNKFFVKRNVDYNFQALGSGITTTILKSDFANPSTALFDYANQIIRNAVVATTDDKTGESNTENLGLNLFQFTNFSSEISISLFTLPATVFKFYRFCLTYYQKEWQNFIYRYYSNSKFKNPTYDSSTEKWINNKEQVDFNSYKTWRNSIYEALLKGNSNFIRTAFLKHSEDHILNFKIVEQYQRNIRNMDKLTLAKLKALAEFIVSKPEDQIKRYMVRLNTSKSSSGLRDVMLRMADDNYNSGNHEPLFSLDEFVEYLFPDGSYWGEIRDLLLIAIYQKLHEQNKTVEVELAEIDSDQNNL